MKIDVATVHEMLLNKHFELSQALLPVRMVGTLIEKDAPLATNPYS